jgi:tRNA(fMet)-specific endonuclease VapC
VTRRLILDTGVIIAAEQKRLDLRQVIAHADPAISPITAMELLSGVTQTAPRKRDMIALGVEAVLAVMPLEPYSMEVARMHAILKCHARQQGRPRGSYDLIIAATAGATGRTLVTTDKAADFEGLPGVNVEVVEQT